MPSGQKKISAPESICVLRLSAIGDCCHTLPVVRTLQAHWPATHITWIIGRTEHGLLNGASGIEFITFDKRDPRASMRDIRRQLGGRHFPLLLHMHASMRANLVSRLVRADMRLGFDRARARDWQWLFSNRKIAARPHQHAMDALFGFAEHLGVHERVLRWDFALSAADREIADQLRAGPRLVCVISPCTSQRFRNYRNWRVENYIAIARHLIDTQGAQIVLTGGPTETEQRYGAEISAGLGSLPEGQLSNLIGKTSLKQLYAVLQMADLLICPDSGPAHMATAAGTPVVGLYATSNRLRTGPYLSQDLVVDAYPEAVRREFRKPVSELRWGERVRDPAAMDIISPEAVIAMCDQALANPRRPSAVIA
jgi:heptosyltransferase I